MKSSVSNQPRNIFFCKKCKTLSPTIEPHKRHKPDPIPDELLKNHIFEEVLGVGAFGAVFKCWDKKLAIYKASKIMFDIEEFDENAEIDLKILRMVNHQYIIKYYGEGKNEEEGWAYVNMELAEMDLKKAIKENLFDTEEKKTLLFKQICEGVAYLHLELERPIIHRDLKPQNILIIRGKPRITDFGISVFKKSFDSGKSSTVSQDAGTESFMPPELISRKGSNLTTNDKHDIWSLGIILHDIFAGENPFKYNDSWVENICNCNYRINYKKIKENSTIESIIKGCLKKDPKQRMNIKDILKILNEETYKKEKSLKEKEQEERKKQEITPVLSPPIPQKNIADARKIEKLIRIIAVLCKNEGFEIYSNSDNVGCYFYKNEIPPHCSSDDINCISNKGIILSHLDIGRCNLEVIKSLAQSIASNNYIELLVIQDESIAKGSLENILYLSKAICQNNSITQLSLENNDLGTFDPDNFELIFRAISQNKTINFLNLSNNNLGLGNYNNIELLSNFISQCINIRVLGLLNTNLGNGNPLNVELIFKAFNQNTTITMVSLAKNDLDKQASINNRFWTQTRQNKKNIAWII